jgi:molecular chaperone DnaK (HSP70)
MPNCAMLKFIFTEMYSFIRFGINLRFMLNFLQRKLERPEEISARVLRKLRESAEQSLNSRSNGPRVKVKRAVVTVPASFRMAQKKATLEAARLAGFEDVQLMSEPAAGMCILYLLVTYI